MEHKLTIFSKPITLTTYISRKSSLGVLDFLVQRFPYHTRSEWKERLESGKVKVNGLVPSEKQPLRAGDEVAYTTNTWEEPEVKKNYRVIYEDKSLFVVSKPAPLPVHAVGAYFQNTLMYLLRQDRPEAEHFHLVHRLDSETSGIILLVKRKELIPPLQKQWEESVQKTYRTIVFGRFEKDELTVNAPLGPKEGSEIRMKQGINRTKGKEAVTQFKLLERKGGFSMVEAMPQTGRLHQIRAHLEHLGYPIVGDKIYSGGDEAFLHFYEHDFDDWLRERVLLPRAALHAFKLEFTHPVTEERLAFEDPLPNDLTDFWNGIG